MNNSVSYSFKYNVDRFSVYEFCHNRFQKTLFVRYSIFFKVLHIKGELRTQKLSERTNLDKFILFGH